MHKGVVYFFLIIVITFCLQMAKDMSLLHSLGIVSSYEYIKQKSINISSSAIVEMNVHGPPESLPNSSKNSSSRSVYLEDAMPEWAKYDVEDLPQIKHAFLKFFSDAPAGGFSLFLLTGAPPWPDKHNLRNLRPPVRAAPHA